MRGPLLVLGRGGHGRVVADAASDCGYDKIAFLDDSPQAEDLPSPFPHLGPISMAGQLLHMWPQAIAAVGNNTLREALFLRLVGLGFEAPSVVHPSAVVSRNAQIGDGVFVAPTAVINVGAKVANAVIINTGARIDHDCVIGAASHIAPGVTLSGGVTIGSKVWLGTGCAVRQGVTIGDEAVIGVGAAVVSDLAPAGTYIGVPARPSEKHQ